MEEPVAGSCEDRVFTLCTGGEHVAGEAGPAGSAVLVSVSFSEFLEIFSSSHHEMKGYRRGLLAQEEKQAMTAPGQTSRSGGSQSQGCADLGARQAPGR